MQTEPPWRYLGWKILEQTIQPQNVGMTANIWTLNDVQKLLGNINWIQTQCAIDNATLTPPFDLLQGDTDINAPQSWTPEAQQALQIINDKLSNQQCHRRSEDIPLTLFVCNQEEQPLAIIGQWDPRRNDPLVILEWVFLPHQPTKTIATRIEMFADLIKKGRERIVELAGEEPTLIVLPIVKTYLTWSIQNSLELQLALAGFSGKLDTHLPPHKRFTFYYNVKIENRPLCQRQPVDGRTVFTDGSGKSGKAVVTWEENGVWKREGEILHGSPQIVELHAVIMAF